MSVLSCRSRFIVVLRCRGVRCSTVSERTYDFLQPSLGSDLYTLLERLRRDDPVFRSEQLRGVVLTRHADVQGALKNTSLVPMNSTARIRRLPAEQQASLEPLVATIGRWISNVGPEGHKRLQSVLNRYFTPRTVESLRPVAQAVLDALLERVSPEEVDVVGELARPLPAAVIAHMLGISPGHEAQIQGWSEQITALFVHNDFEQLLRTQRSMLEMSEFLRPLIAARRDDPRDDLLSVLVQAQAEGTVLDEDEIVANCGLLLFAGHETTARLIVHGLVALLEHPDQLTALREQPSLRGNAIEEMLRYDGPAGTLVRVSPVPLEIGGVAIGAGEPIFVCLAAANRDGDVFEAPERFDITRSNARKSLAFGTGVSYCLGAALARLEADVFFETLLRRYSSIEALDSAPAWLYTPPFNRGLLGYRVRLSS
jgi:cytochrome P450